MNRWLTRIGAVAGLVATAAAPQAADFPISAGSYTADVAYRLYFNGSRLGSASQTMANCSTQGGSAANIVDYGFPSWQIQSIQDANGTATATIGLDKKYSLNSLVLQYGDYRPAEQEIRVSPDGTTWSTLLARSAVGAQTVPISFAATDVRQVAWQIWGPGTTAGGATLYAYPMELKAFAASSGPAPQREDGYNLAGTMTMVSQDGWISYQPASYVIDGNFYSYAIRNAEGTPAHALFDLGALYPLTNIKLDFAYGQNWTGGGAVEVSADQSTWYTVFRQTSLLGNGIWSFPPWPARYVRLTSNGYGSGALGELGVFALVPEPAALSMLLIGAGLCLRRRR